MTELANNLQSLFDIVCEARIPTSRLVISNLKDSLDSYKETFVNLLNYPSKNQEHRKLIESGKTTIDGKEHRVNAEFIKEALFLSDQLDIDEYEASRFLLTGISEASKLNSSSFDSAVQLFHSEREYILTILNVILESVKDENVDAYTKSVFSEFIWEVVQEGTSESFIQRILKTGKKLIAMASSISKTNILQLETEAQPQTIYAQPAPTEQQLKFKQETIHMRIDKLNDERLLLVQILYNIASLYRLPEDDLLAILTQLQSIHLSDATCPYILAALLAALPSPINSQDRKGATYSNNVDFLKKVHSTITEQQWKTNILKSVVQLQWSMFLTVETSSNPNINTRVCSQENRLSLARTAMTSDAFGFMNHYLLYFKQEQIEEKPHSTIKMDDDSAMAIDGLIVDPNDYTKFEAVVSYDFKKDIIHEMQCLVESVIYHMVAILLDLKSSIVDGTTQIQALETNSESSGVDATNIISDSDTLSMFLSLSASVYRDRRNSGLKFWINSDGLSTFVSWLMEFKIPALLPAIFDFLGSIATGEECAHRAHAYMKMGITDKDIKSSHLFSWGKLFASLQFYVELFESIKSDLPHTLPLDERESLVKFLYLCQQVVQYSEEARLDIWNNPSFNTASSVFGMIGCPTSNRLRSALYGLLTAFCSSWGGGANGAGKQIALEVWAVLENSSMVIPEKVLVPSLDPSPGLAASKEPSVSTLFGNTNGQPELLNIQPITTATKPKKPVSATSFYLPEQPSGFLREFDEEKIKGVYPETFSVLNLFASLIHTQSKRQELISGFSADVPSIPGLLGHNSRSPGTAPYMSLIIDHIFLKLGSQQYVNPDTRWQLTDACLVILENSISSFYIEPFCDSLREIRRTKPLSVINYSERLPDHNSHASRTESEKNLQQALAFAVSHPGFDVLIRILSGSALILEIFKIVQSSKTVMTEDKSKYDKDSPCFTKVIVRCLRLFKKVFEVQNLFVNVFLPQLRQTATKLPMGGFKLADYTFPAIPSSFCSIGDLMLYNGQMVIQIASMVNYGSNQDICSASTLVLAQLASQPDSRSSDLDIEFEGHVSLRMGGIGSKLASILLSSSESTSIMFNFSERLEIDIPEITTFDDYEYDINVIPFWLAKKTLDDVYRYDDGEFQYTPSAHISIMDLLLNNISDENPSPTLSELLLGYDVSDIGVMNTQQKSIPIDTKNLSRVSCLYSILNMLQAGTEPSNRNETPFVRTHPILAEKCYQLIYKLSARVSTSTATLHYLRNCDDFLTKQFLLIACRLEKNLDVVEPSFAGTMICSDHSEVKTDFLTLRSVLYQRAWLLKLIALELRSTAKSSVKSFASKLLDLLYGISNVPASRGSTLNFEGSLASQMESLDVRLSERHQQPLWNLLEIVNSLEFVWKDDMDTTSNNEGEHKKIYFEKFDTKSYMTNKDGCLVYDIRGVYSKLRQQQYILAEKNQLSNEERLEMETEMGRILQDLLIKNRDMEISFARLHCLRAWKNVVEITLSDCYDLFDYTTREKVIYDLLGVLLPKLEQENNFHPDILTGLSEIILGLLTRLRVDKRKRAILQVAPAETGHRANESDLPDEKLRSVFNSIVNCIYKKSSTIEVRSGMYSALVNLLQYITLEDKLTSVENLPNNIRTHVIDIISGAQKEKLLDIICSDASEGVNMHKSTAYMALEALYVLIGQSKGALIHTYLAKQSFLKYNIDMIAPSDTELYTVIKCRDVSLTPLYNHEAKISLFLRIALKREGSTLLLRNGILRAITNRKFMDVDLDHDSNKDSNIDITKAIQLHRRLLTPILELVNTMLKSLSGLQGERMNEFKTWTKSQSTLMIILKDRYREITLSSLYLLRLATSIVYQLSCQPKHFNTVDSTDSDSLDNAMMELVSKYCLSSSCASSVVPTNSVEEKWSKQSIPETINGQQARTLLETKAESYVNEIRNNLLAYAVSSTFRPSYKKTISFKPIFTHTLKPITDSVQFHKASLEAPSLSTLVACLSFVYKKLTIASKEYDLLCTQIGNVGSLKYEETLEIADSAIPNNLGIEYDSLNPNQQFQLLSSEIAHRRNMKVKEIRQLILSVETATTLLWRHLEYYTNKESIDRTYTTSPCDHSKDMVVLRLQQLYKTSAPLIDALKKDCRLVVEPVISKLESISLKQLNSKDLSSMYARLRVCYN